MKPLRSVVRMFALASVALILGACGGGVPTASQNVEVSQGQALPAAPLDPALLAQFQATPTLHELAGVLERDGLSINWNQAVVIPQGAGQFVTVPISGENRFLTLGWASNQLESAALVQVQDARREHYALTRTDLLRGEVLSSTVNLETRQLVGTVSSGLVLSRSSLSGLSTVTNPFLSAFAACNVPQSLLSAKQAADRNLVGAAVGFSVASGILVQAQASAAACFLGPVGCAAFLVNIGLATLGVAGASFFLAGAQDGQRSAQEAINEWRAANCK